MSHYPGVLKVENIAYPNEKAYFQAVMTTRAYAKINLGLWILGKREDGFHNIETIFHRIDLHDTISFEPSSTISLTTNRHDLPTDESNLCVRAAVLLQKKFGIHQGVHLMLEKKISVGAGLGGGSADAATVLNTLPLFWKKNVNHRELFSLALKLGSDVPYFLKHGSAYATGRGEKLEYFDLDLPYWIVTVSPNLNISTAWAYQNVQVKNQKGKGKSSLISNPKSQISNHRPVGPSTIPRTSLKAILLEHLHDPRMLRNLLQNDFEPLVLRTYEVVARLKKNLYDAGALFVQLSGSGSSLYGLFTDKTSGEKAQEQLGGQYQVSLTPPNFRPAV